MLTGSAIRPITCAISAISGQSRGLKNTSQNAVLKHPIRSQYDHNRSQGRSQKKAVWASLDSDRGSPPGLLELLTRPDHSQSLQRVCFSATHHKSDHTRSQPITITPITRSAAISAISDHAINDHDHDHSPITRSRAAKSLTIKKKR